ncbi:MAG TPA: hypothetical protein VN837_17530 [Chloroflexota bacterium]|nr:hypothetical protein [Chloroflexota bacterium]
MARSVSRFARLALAIGLLGIGTLPFEAHARSVAQAARVQSARAARGAGARQTTAVLVWQGKILPIVTDVYASLSDLSVALQNRDYNGIATTGDQFAGERQRFDLIKPTPHSMSNAAKVLDQGLRELTNGTKSLVVGLRDSDSAGSQRAANQVENGLKLFNQAVGQIRRMNGPVAEPTVIPNPNAGPVPTPIIKGLP